ncbi:hypothetical protein SAMN02745866_01184 [Alteromonadaceae bacterium Bs31]|nr:hypothetical protein SAMN02745866_01184 [Alteromonadaceae bacterium Bs31]
MKKAALLLTLLSVTACNKETTDDSYACENLDANTLAAVFEVQNQALPKQSPQQPLDDQKDGASKTAKLITLWRSEGRSAHQYEQAAITTAWALDKKAGLLSWQYFDSEQRAIEYEATHLPEHASQRVWQEKRQIVSNELIKKMTFERKSGSGCNTREFYSLQKNGGELKLQWLSELQLPALFEIKNKNTHTQWKLKELRGDKRAVKLAFSRRDAYYSTDYTDIGDNESDPFLLKMMNLGFIEHGASGFYNTEGNAIAGAHAH